MIVINQSLFAIIIFDMPYFNNLFFNLMVTCWSETCQISVFKLIYPKNSSNSFFHINLRSFFYQQPLRDVSANLLVGGAGWDADSRGGL